MISLLVLFGHPLLTLDTALTPPLSTTGNQFVKSTSIGRIKVTTPLFYCFTLNPGKALLNNPIQRGYLRWIGRIYQSQAVVGVNGSTMVVMFVIFVLVVDSTFCTNCTLEILWGGSFIPARTLIGVKLLTG